MIDGQEVRIGATVGIALAPHDGVTFDRLAVCADASLYQAKHNGRGSVVFAGESPAPRRRLPRPDGWGPNAQLPLTPFRFSDL